MLAASSMKKLKNKKTKASIKLSGEKKLGKANKDLKKLKNKKAKVTLNVSGQKRSLRPQATLAVTLARLFLTRFISELRRFSLA